VGGSAKHWECWVKYLYETIQNPFPFPIESLGSGRNLREHLINVKGEDALISSLLPLAYEDWILVFPGNMGEKPPHCEYKFPSPHISVAKVLFVKPDQLTSVVKK